MKKPRFLVLPLVPLILLGLMLLATPRASAQTLQPPPPPLPDGTCTPRIDTLGYVADNTLVITISLNECAQQLIVDGTFPDQISTFVVTYQDFISVDGQYASTITTIVANHLQELMTGYTTCGNTHTTLITWGTQVGVTQDEVFQQLIDNAVVETGCNQPLTPGPR